MSTSLDQAPKHDLGNGVTVALPSQGLTRQERITLQQLIDHTMHDRGEVTVLHFVEPDGRSCSLYIRQVAGPDYYILTERHGSGSSCRYGVTPIESATADALSSLFFHQDSIHLIGDSRTSPIVLAIASAWEQRYRSQQAPADAVSLDGAKLPEGVKGAEYELSGGSEVVVFSPFKGQQLLAVVDLKGEYPERGAVARNEGRDEFVLIERGSCTITVNNVPRTLHTGENLLIRSGDSYFMHGDARCIVMVRDGEGAATVIETKEGPRQTVSS